jgi:hypothetical protein
MTCEQANKRLVVFMSHCQPHQNSEVASVRDEQEDEEVGEAWVVHAIA